MVRQQVYQAGQYGYHYPHYNYYQAQYPAYTGQYPGPYYQQSAAQYYQQYPSSYYQQHPGPYYQAYQPQSYNGQPIYHCPTCGTPIHIVYVTVPQSTPNGLAGLMIAVLVLLAIDIVFLRQ